MQTIQPYMFGVDPLNLSERSPYTPATLYGLPPYYEQLDPIVWVNGVPTIRGVPLGSLRNTLAQNIAQPLIPSAQPVARVTQSIDRGKYGDATILALTFAGAGLGVIGGTSVILARPNNTRAELLIVNSTVAGQIFYNFDQDADNVASVPIAQNGNRLWDTVVPQGNLSIFSSGAGVVVIEYININLNG